MEKKTSKIIAFVGIIAVLISVFAVGVSASDVSVNEENSHGILTTSIPLKAIEYHDIVGFGTVHKFSAIVDNPFVLYDYLFENNDGEYRNGKMGVVLNYPYQSSSFTDSGRTIWYTFTLDSYRNLYLYQPMEYSNGNYSRLPNNSRYTDYYFDDFIIHEDSEMSFSISHATTSVEYLENYEWTFEVVLPTENETAYDVRIITGSSPVESTVSFDRLLAFCASNGVYIEDDEMFIRNLRIRYVPFEYNLPDDDNKVTDCTILTQARHIGSDSLDIDAWYYNHPLKDWYVESIGDSGLLDWLQTALGGFFDFEFVPNVSFGGLLLLSLTVGIVMLLIRIFRG